MRQLAILSLSLCALMQLTAQTVPTVSNGRSSDATAPQLSVGLQRQVAAARLSADRSDALIPLLITTDNPQQLARRLRSDGHRATPLSASLVSARVPACYVTRLQQLSTDIRFIDLSRQFCPTMDVARPAIGADRLHQGDLLETPYTGKGVVIGVIDQGFEYRHIAVMDADGKQPRTLAVWNRKGYALGTDTEPTTDIPANGDGLQASGHAMHVTNIAAGTHIAENDYYGVAPEADIIMIPSEFAEAEILEDVDYIRNFAETQGKPWVINMSFGSTLGPHDGTDPASQYFDQLLSERGGRMICIAAGNEGAVANHVAHTFTASGETVELLVNPGTNGTIGQLWGQLADGQQHLTLKPYLYKDGQKDYRDADFWSELIFHDVAPYNQKELHQFAVGGALKGYQLGLEVTADVPMTFHAWTGPYLGEFVAPGEQFLQPDHRQSIDDFGACASQTVTVANYVASNSYINSRGFEVSEADAGGIGQLNRTSGVGPSLGVIGKPTIAAPGTAVKSAVSKYGYGFSAQASYIVQDVKRGIRHFYYGAMSGTSMATPVVTGTIALWLQANPALTSEQIHHILRQTARHDDFTGNDEWSPLWGYGKLDAYEGLKMALQLGDVNGIPALQTAQQPFTLLRQTDQWRVLMNSNEPSVSLTVSTLSGAAVLIQNYTHLHRGQEFLLPLRSLPSGVYVVALSAGKSRQTYKLSIAQKQ